MLTEFDLIDGDALLERIERRTAERAAQRELSAREVQDDILERAVRKGWMSESEARDLRRRRDTGLPFLDIPATLTIAPENWPTWAERSAPAERDDIEDDIEPVALRAPIDIPDWLL